MEIQNLPANEIYTKDELQNLFVKGYKDTEDMKYRISVFDSLYNFYYGFYRTERYQIKIMITRRSYVLFKIFSKVFEKKENHTDNFVFYTNNYIPLIKKDVINNRILIIDDIIINGRTAKKAYELLAKTVNMESSDLSSRAKIAAFLVNRDGYCINAIKDYFIDKKDIAFISEYGWREISDLLNNFIARVNIGYTSYIDTYSFSKESKIFSHVEAGKNNTSTIRQRNALFDKEKINSYIQFPCVENYESDNKKFFEFLKKLDITPVYRFYFYNDVCNFIPFVYLPTIKQSQFKDFFDLVVVHIGKKENYKEQLNFVKNIANGCNTDEKYIFLYEWVTFVLSKCLASVFFSELESNVVCQNVNLSCEENFKKAYIPFVSFDNNVSEINKDFSISNQLIEKTQETQCVDLFRSTYENFMINKKSFNIHELFSNYLFKTRNLGQNRAKNHLQRLKGIRVEDIVGLTQFQKNDVISDLINCWDCGDGSGSPKIFDQINGTQDKIISTSTINGEQIYRFPFDFDPQVTNDYKIYYENCLLPHSVITKTFRSFAKYMYSITANKNYFKFADAFSEENYHEFINGINSDYITDVKDAYMPTKYFNDILNFANENTTKYITSN